MAKWMWSTPFCINGLGSGVMSSESINQSSTHNSPECACPLHIQIFTTPNTHEHTCRWYSVNSSTKSKTGQV